MNAENKISCHCSEYCHDEMKNIDPKVSTDALAIRGKTSCLSSMNFITNNYTLKPNDFQLFKKIFGKGALIDISRLSSGCLKDISRE